MHARIAVMRAFGFSQLSIAERIGCDHKTVAKYMKENAEFMERFISFVSTFVDGVRAEVTEAEQILKDEYVAKQEEFLGEMHQVKKTLLKSKDDRVKLAVIQNLENRVYGTPKNTTRHEGAVAHNVRLMPGPMPSLQKGIERRALKAGHVPNTKAHDDSGAADTE